MVRLIGSILLGLAASCATRPAFAATTGQLGVQPVGLKAMVIGSATWLTDAQKRAAMVYLSVTPNGADYLLLAKVVSGAVTISSTELGANITRLGGVALSGSVFSVVVGNALNIAQLGGVALSSTTLNVNAIIPAGAPGSAAATPIYAAPSGVKSITNTCYVQSFTTSITGVGWVDCRGASSVIVTLRVKATNDYAALLGAGVTLYADASGELSSNLPNTNVVPQWNLQALPNPQTGTGVSVDTQFVYPDPPASLRWRLHGIFNATASILYTINFPISGSNYVEAGSTPPLH